MKGTKISKIFQLIGTVLNGSVLQITCWLKPNTELGPILVSPSGLTKPCEYTFSTSIQDVSYLKIMLWIYLQISKKPFGHSEWLTFLKKLWLIPGIFFLYFHLFNTIQLTVNKYSIKNCQCVDSNRRPLELEATTLPTVTTTAPTVARSNLITRNSSETLVLS